MVMITMTNLPATKSPHKFSRREIPRQLYILQRVP